MAAARPSPAEPPGSSDSTRWSNPARSSFGRLSLITLGCFAVGLSWPLLADLQFVQRPPGSTPSKPEEREAPPLDIDPESKPSPPPPAQRSPLARDQGVRAAAKVAAVTSERARPSAADSSSADELVVMSGQATIGWKAAVVRKGPSSQAETVERIAYGTRVSVTGRQGEWYRVKYGRKGQAGWVHRKALGL
jgi:Bacterial SH3 domain